MIAFTRFTSISPRKITKTLKLTASGDVQKDVPPQSSRAWAEILKCENISSFAALLPTLTPAQALCYGVPNEHGDEFEVLSKAALPMDRTPQQIARTKEHFTWPAGPGVLMLDHDAAKGKQPMSRDDLLATLEAVIPSLRDTAYVWFPSASSYIWHGDTEVAGLKGQRVYVAVKDARDLERAGKVIVERLWLAGHGWYEVSKSGSLLKRTIIDASVWQTNRLDYAAGADCVPPLEQRRGEPLVLGGATELLDTRELLTDLSAEESATLEGIHQRAKAAVAGEADEVRREYVLNLANELSAGDAETFTKSRAIAEQAVMNQRLMGDFPLALDDGTMLTVGDVLDAREKYHGRQTLDPLERDYDGGRTVGKLYLIGGRPVLHSFAHGSRTFKLIRAPRRVESVSGRTSDLIDRTLEALRGAPDLFDLGDSIVTIEGGRIVPLTESTLSYMVGHELQFWCRKKTPNGIEYEADLDPPQKVIKALIDMGRARKLRPLDAVITAPTIRTDGTLLNEPGYDARSRLFFDAQGRSIPSIPSRPTQRQAVDALERLMRPFESFPFAGVLDRSVLLSGLLTAAIRPAVPTAPGIAFDAPIQGSGKTLLARCIGILACGAEASVWPHVATGRDAETEIRKRLMTALLKGDGALIWDNVIGNFDSASIAAFLTAPSMTDRILGQSRDATVPNRAVFLLTGNNVVLAGDLPRRFLTCRIDPQTDRPFARRFDLNPAAHCHEHRPQMISDALTVVRAWLSSDERAEGWRAPGATASFEDWDALVRQTVAWLATKQPGQWCDPLDSITLATSNDPEAEQLSTLLEALHRAFGTSSFTAVEVAKHAAASSGVHDEFSVATAIEDITGKRDSSTKTIGRALLYRKDRRANGKRLVNLGKSANVTTWAIRCA